MISNHSHSTTLPSLRSRSLLLPRIATVTDSLLPGKGFCILPWLKIIGHRGYSARHPENTMRAFRAAWETGCAGIELDVQLTADHELVVFHDLDGLRLAGQSKFIAEATWPEISTWSIGSEKAPLLQDVLAASPDDCLTLIEIKGDARCLKRIDRVLTGFQTKQYAILSFEPSIALKAALLGHPSWLNVEPAHVGETVALLPSFASSGIRGISMGWSSILSPKLIASIHDARMESAVWTVNTISDAQLAVDAGVGYLMTDDPGLMTSRFFHVS